MRVEGSGFRRLTGVFFHVDAEGEGLPVLPELGKLDHPRPVFVDLPAKREWLRVEGVG